MLITASSCRTPSRAPKHRTLEGVKFGTASTPWLPANYHAERTAPAQMLQDSQAKRRQLAREVSWLIVKKNRPSRLNSERYAANCTTAAARSCCSFFRLPLAPTASWHLVVVAKSTEADRLGAAKELKLGDGDNHGAC